MRKNFDHSIPVILAVHANMSPSFHSFFFYRSAISGSDIVLVSKITSYKNPNYTNLRSHEIDDVVVLIGNKFTIDVKVKIYLIVSIPIMLIVWTIFRKAFRVYAKTVHSDLSSVIFDTLGTFLATNTSFRIRNLPERIMNASILLLSILTSRLASAFILNYIMAKSIDDGINTMSELSEIDIDIYVSDELLATMDDWSQNLR